MSDVSQGPGWWLASDGKWYPPDTSPGTPAPGAAPTYGAPGEGYGVPQPAANPWAQPGGYGPAPGYGPGPGYGYPYTPNMHGTASGLPSVSGQATASMVLGILAAIPCYVTPLLGLVGLPLGIVAMRKINKGEADSNGKGMAVAGVVLSSIGIVWLVLFIILIIASVNDDPYSMGVFGPTI